MASLVYIFRRCNQVKMKKEQFKSIARIVKKNMADEAGIRFPTINHHKYFK
jgi:hypothetical protein